MEALLLGNSSFIDCAASSCLMSHVPLDTGQVQVEHVFSGVMGRVGCMVGHALLFTPLMMLWPLCEPSYSFADGFVVPFNGGAGSIKTQQARWQYFEEVAARFPYNSRGSRTGSSNNNHLMMATKNICRGQAPLSLSMASESDNLVVEGAAVGVPSTRVSGKEAVENAAESLVPLFAEVDAHTQR